eukprot:2118610-Amphidinium_carterae.2
MMRFCNFELAGPCGVLQPKQCPSVSARPEGDERASDPGGSHLSVRGDLLRAKLRWTRTSTGKGAIWVRVKVVESCSAHAAGLKTLRRPLGAIASVGHP